MANDTVSTNMITGAASGAVNSTADGAEIFADSVESIITGATGLSPAVADIVAAVAIIIIFFSLSLCSKWVVRNIVPHFVSRTGSTLDDEILKAADGPLQTLFAFTGLYLASKTVNNLSTGLTSMLDTLATVAVTLVGAYFVSNLISAFIRWYINDVAPKTESDLDDHLLPFVNKLLIAGVYAVAALMVMVEFGVQITPLIASLGVMGIAVAFAAKESLSSIFGAFAIMTDRPYKVGDRLILPGVGQADVLDVGLRSTRIRSLDNRIVIIPNEDIARSRIVNMSKPDSKVRVTVNIGISYRSDVDRACEILEEIAMSMPEVSREPKARAYVSSLDEFSVNIMLLAWIESYRNDLLVPDSIYRETLERFEKEGIEIPFPIVTVQPKQKAS